MHSSSTKVRQSPKRFQNTEMFCMDEQAKAGREVVSLGYEEVGHKLGGDIAKFIQHWLPFSQSDSTL